MNGRGKQVLCNEDHQDRFGALPTNLIISILTCMPLRDAARTSILSQRWRYLWANNPYLVFDEKEFYDNLFRNKPFVEHKFISAINSIILSHMGPIHKFILFIPPSNLRHLASDIDNWILVVSRNHIKQLTIQNSNFSPYNLPSYVLNCSELTHLHLTRCILSPPLHVKGLKTLVCIYLEGMHFSAELMRTLVLPSLQVLRHLEFKNCYGLANLRIHLPNLRRLRIMRGDGFDLRFFETNQCVELVHIDYHIRIDIQKHNQEHNGTDNLVKLFDNICKTEDLKLSRYPLNFLAAGGVPNSLPNLNNQLTKVCLCNFEFSHLELVSFALCLLRSSPNLKILEINACIWSPATEPVEIIDILEKPICLERRKEPVLNKLMTVKLTYLNVTRIELLFIKLLFSHSSRLESLRIELNNSLDEERILTELLRFKTQSPKTEFIVISK